MKYSLYIKCKVQKYNFTLIYNIYQKGLNEASIKEHFGILYSRILTFSLLTNLELAHSCFIL